MIKRFALLTLIAGLSAFVAVGLYRRFTRAVEPAPQAQPADRQPELGTPVKAESEEAASAGLALSDAQPPRELANGAEIFLISGYQAGGQTRVRVTLDRPGKRVLLVLTSYERVVWQVDASDTTAVTGILVSANRGSTLQTGLKTQAFAVKLPHAYQTDNMNFGSLLEQLNGWFGISRIDAFRGAYSLQPAIEISQVDAENPLLTLAGPPVQGPSRNFRFVLHTRDYSPVAWTLTGQDDGRNLGYIAEGKFAVSPGGAIYSLKQDDLAIVDRKTGTQRDFPLPDNFPAFSWPMDVAYDSRRDIVSVVSLGGEGFFYRFDARAQKWIDFRSMNNIDVYSLAYDKNLDRYVAWTSTDELLFISGEGHALFKARVSDKLPGFGRLYDRNNSPVPRIGIAPDGNDIALVAFSGDSVRSIWEYEVESQIGRLTYRSK